MRELSEITEEFMENIKQIIENDVNVILVIFENKDKGCE